MYCSSAKKSGSERPVEKLEYENGRIGEAKMNADNQTKKSKRRKTEVSWFAHKLECF